MREFEDFPVRALRRPPRSREISPHFVRHFTPVVAKGRDAWSTLQQAEGHLARVRERFANGLARPWLSTPPAALAVRNSTVLG
jgi:hypothetical protein